MSEAEERYREALERLITWTRAYPVEVFPEPDLVKARELLDRGGMTLDAVSASNFRYVLTKVREIAEEALK